MVSNIDEQKSIHKEITWEKYKTLSQEERESDTIYFITDTDLSDTTSIINKLINEIKELEQLLAAAQGS